MKKRQSTIRHSTARRILMPRRTLLRGAGGFAVGLPLLDAMIPSNNAVAQAVLNPQRFGVFFSSCGVVRADWVPTGTERDFVLNKNMQSLLPHKEDLVILQGIDAQSSLLQMGNPHDVSMVHMLTAIQFTGMVVGKFSHLVDGNAGGPSVDQVIANHIGGETALRSLELGVEASVTSHPPLVKRMCYGGPGDPRDPMDDPGQVFARLVGDGIGDPVAIEALHVQRRSVLDAVYAEFQSTNAALGGTDKEKLDRHATAIRELEQRIGVGVTTDCDFPAVAPQVMLETVACQRNGSADTCVTGFAEVGRAQTDLMVLALACDLTRVVSLQWSTAESTKVHENLGMSNEHHRMSHDYGNNAERLSAITTWYAEQFAYLLTELKKVPEAGGTLLDNMLLLWTNEMSQGDTHSSLNLPYVIAGGCGGKLETNRFVRYAGVPHSHLYSLFLQMFGVPDTAFGELQFQGMLTGLA